MSTKTDLSCIKCGAKDVILCNEDMFKNYGCNNCGWTWEKEHMTTKHTPGPWWIAENETTFAVGAGNIELAHVGQTMRKATIATHKQSKANATLIAAAPDLKSDLEKQNRAIWQLCDMVNAYSEKLGLGKKVNAADWVRMGALAKAEGR